MESKEFPPNELKMRIVKINEDDASQIAELFGVSEIVAKRVIEFRELYGFFETPSDLAQVQGISQSLALTLSPHIDWSLPRRQYTATKINWFAVAFGVVALVTWVWLLVANFQEFFLKSIDVLTLTDIQMMSLSIVLLATFLLSFILIGALFLATLLENLTTHVERRAKLYRIKLKVLVLSVIFVIIASICVSLVLTYPSSERAIFRSVESTNFRIGFLLLALAIPSFGFVTFYFWRPNFANKHQLFWIFDAVTLIAMLQFGYASVVNASSLGIGISMLLFVVAITCVYYSIRMLNSRNSIFGYIWLKRTMDELDLRYEQIQQFRESPVSNQMYWLNTHLPNPEHQMALLDALKTVYPAEHNKHPLRTMIQVLVVGLGGWLISQTAGAIWEWLVQNILESIIN